MANHKLPPLAPVLKDDALYLGDNGRCLCGKHSGASARYTGRDISGQRVVEITLAAARTFGEDVSVLRCEIPSCDVRPPVPTFSCPDCGAPGLTEDELADCCPRDHA